MRLGFVRGLGRMNLCLLCRDVTSGAASGLVRATCDLAEALADQGHTVHLLTDRFPVPAPRLGGVSIERLTVPAASGPFQDAAVESAPHNLMHAAAAWREVARIHERERPVDAVLAPLWRSEAAVCLLDARFPTVVTCMTSLRTICEIDPRYRELPDIQERLALESKTVMRARYLHGLTHAVLSKTIEDFGLAPQISAVVGRGLRDAAGAAAHRDNGQNDGRPLELLFVGRLEARKGVDVLIDAAGELVDDGLAFNLRLAGPNADPNLRLRLEQNMAQRPGLADAVQFTGPVSDAELAHLYRASDVVCLPSRYESHGVTLVEALMFGKPIVTCDGGGIGEVVEPERTALVSPPDDPPALARALRRVLADPELRRTLGSSARASFERRFDARGVALEMESFLADVRAHHQASETSRETVRDRLEALMQDAHQLLAGEAAGAAAELLDLDAGEPVRRLRAAARDTPMAPVASVPGRVTAVVLTNDRAELLERALDSLRVADPPVETIVIDNGSSPTHARRVEALCGARDRVRLRRSDQNTGLNPGRLVGLELADTEFVLFLDDDAELLPGALAHLIAELDSHPSAGAVSATVVSSDGRVSHSGGQVKRGAGVVTFGLIGSNAEFGTDRLPPSGPAGWVGFTALLVRRELLEEFPLDPQMAAYFDDNEWCYRVSRARPGSFRRSREALVLHRLAANVPQGGATANARRIDLLAAVAHFYQRHGVVLAPWTVDSVLPELRADDGTADIRSAQLLMELFLAKGREWTFSALNEGRLDGLLNAHRDLTHARAETERLKQTIAAQEEGLESLKARHETLARIEQGGWWQLRDRILPLIRIAGAARRRLDAAKPTPAEPAHRVQLHEPLVDGHEVVFSWEVTPPTELYRRTNFRLSFPPEVDVAAVPRALWWRILLLCLHAHFALLRPCVVELPISLGEPEREFWRRLIGSVVTHIEAYGDARRPGFIVEIRDSGPSAQPVPLPNAADRAVLAFSAGKDSLVLAGLAAELIERPLLVTITSPVPWARDHVGEARGRALAGIADRLPVELLEVHSDFRTSWELGFTSRTGCALGVHELSDIPLYYGALAAVAAASGIGRILMASEAEAQYNSTIDGHTVVQPDPMSAAFMHRAVGALLHMFGQQMGSLTYPLHAAQVQALLLRRYRSLADLQFSCWQAPEGQRACSTCSKCFGIALVTLAEGVSPRAIGMDPVKALLAYTDWQLDATPPGAGAFASASKLWLFRVVRALQSRSTDEVAAILSGDRDPRLGEALAVYARLRDEALAQSVPPLAGYVVHFLDLVPADLREPLERILAQDFEPLADPELAAMAKRAKALGDSIAAPLAR